MTCHLCHEDRETCGCWELVEEYGGLPMDEEELLLRRLNQNTVQ